MQGFVLNGVGKVAYYGDRAELQRIGRRWGQYSRREVRVFTGFRLNGVMRGGSYELDSNVVRNDRRRSMGSTTVNSKVGFRCEGC